MRLTTKLALATIMAFLWASQAFAGAVDQVWIVNEQDTKIGVAWTATEFYAPTVEFQEVGGSHSGSVSSDMPDVSLPSVYLVTVPSLKSKTHYQFYIRVNGQRVSGPWDGWTTENAMGPYAPHTMSGFVKEEVTPGGTVLQPVQRVLVVLKARRNGEESHDLAVLTNSLGGYSFEGMLLKDQPNNQDDMPPVAFYDKNGDRLPDEGTYTYHVKACGTHKGNGELLDYVHTLGTFTFPNIIAQGDFTPPGNISNLSACPAVIGQNMISLHWTNPADDPADPDYQGPVILRKMGAPMRMVYTVSDLKGTGRLTIDEQYKITRREKLTVGQMFGDSIRVVAVPGTGGLTKTDTHFDDTTVTAGTIYWYVGVSIDEIPNYADPTTPQAQLLDVTEEMMANPWPDLDIANDGTNGGLLEGNTMHLKARIKKGEKVTVTGDFVFVNPYISHPYNVDGGDGPGNEHLMKLRRVYGTLSRYTGQKVEAMTSFTGMNDTGYEWVSNKFMNGFVNIEIPDTTVGGTYEGWVKLQAVGKYSECAGVTTADSFMVVLEITEAEQKIDVLPNTPPGLAVVTTDDAASNTFDSASGRFTVHNNGRSDLTDILITRENFPTSWIFTFNPTLIPSLLFNMQTTVDFHIAVPDNFKAGSYTGQVRASGSSGTPTDATNLKVTIPAEPAFTIAPTLAEFTADAGNLTGDYGDNIVVTNIGNIKLKDITFTNRTLKRTVGNAEITVDIATIASLDYNANPLTHRVSFKPTATTIGGDYWGVVKANAVSDGDPAVPLEVVFDVHVKVINANEVNGILIDEACAANDLTANGDPGETVEFAFCVKNLSNTDLNGIDFSAVFSDAQAGFRAAFTPSQLDIPWKESRTVNAFVTIPDGQSMGTYTGSFCATDDDGAPKDCATFTLNVNAHCDWMLLNHPTSTISVRPGQTQPTTFEIHNTGNAPITGFDVEDVHLTDDDGNLLTGNVQSFTATIVEGNFITVTIELDVDAEQIAGIYTGEVVVSQGNCGGVNGSVGELSFPITVEVLPIGGWTITLKDNKDVVMFLDMAPGAIPQVMKDHVVITNTSNCAITDISADPILLTLGNCATVLTASVDIDVAEIPAFSSMTFDAMIDSIPLGACAGTYRASENFSFTAQGCMPLTYSALGAQVTITKTCNITIPTAKLSFSLNHNSSDLETFTVRNNSNQPVVVNIPPVTGSVGVQFSSTQETIPVGGSAAFEVTVTAPLGLLAGTYPFAIHVNATAGCHATLDADVTVRPSFDIDVCGDLHSVTIAPGGTQNTPVVTVNNPNSLATNSCDTNDGPANAHLSSIAVTWTPLVMGNGTAFKGEVTATKPASINSGNNGQVTFTVKANASELDGVYMAVVTVSGQGANGVTVSDVFNLSVTVESRPAIVLEGNADFAGAPGDRVTKTLTVRNTGNVMLTGINLAHTFQPSFDVSFDQPGFSLAPLQTKPVIVTVVIPMPEVACAGDYPGIINVSASNVTATAFVNSKITVNPMYAFTLGLTEGGVVFTGTIGQVLPVRSALINNTGNTALGTFSAVLKTKLMGKVTNVEFPSANVAFAFPTSVACHASGSFTVTVTVPALQDADTYEGSFEIREAHNPTPRELNVRIEIKKEAAMTAEWAAHEAVEDGIRSHIGAMTIRNTGNSELTDVVMEIVGAGFWRESMSESVPSIMASMFTFEPRTFYLAKGATKMVDVYVDVPKLLLNGMYVGQVSATDANSRATAKDDVDFEVMDGRMYAVGPNPVRFPDDHGAMFYFAPDASVDGVRIYNMAGDLVRDLPVDGPATEWNLTNDEGEEVASGMYICLVMDGGAVVHQLKVMVIKSNNRSSN